MIKKVLFILSLMLITTVIFAQNIVIYTAGQSNAYGMSNDWATAALYECNPAYNSVSINNTNDGWCALSNSCFHYPNTGQGYGLVLSMADRITKMGYDSVFVCQYANTSTPLGNAVEAVNNWSAPSGTYYIAAKARFIIFKNLLGARDYTPYFLWWQGENDSGNATDAANYETNLTTLLDSMKLIIGANMHVILVKLNTSGTGTWRGTVNAAIVNVAATYPNTYLIDANDWPIYNVNHMTGENYLNFGINAAYQIFWKEPYKHGYNKLLIK